MYMVTDMQTKFKKEEPCVKFDEFASWTAGDCEIAGITVPCLLCI
jgi:hypothetical protein